MRSGAETLGRAMESDRRPVIGLFGIGSDHYWPQFEGLRARLEGLISTVADRLGQAGARVASAGLVDDPRQAAGVVERFSAAQVQAIFVHVTTYARSYTVLPIVRSMKVPVVVIALQPTRTLDFDAFNAMGDRRLMTGEWLAHCQAVTAPEISSVFRRAGINFRLVTGFLDQSEPWQEIAEWIGALKVTRALEFSIVGVLGHADNGMMDLYTDLTALSATTGCTFEIIEMAEVESSRAELAPEKVQSKLGEFDAVFDVDPECTPEELRRQARTACALDALVGRRGLAALAYFYEGTAGSAGQDVVTSIIAGNSILTTNGVPVAGECDVRTVLAMKILSVAGAGGAFSEFYYMDFERGHVLLGHDGPSHLGMATGRVRLVPLTVFHGKPGSGLSIQMSVRPGPVTLLALVDAPDGTLEMLVAEGEAVEGPVFEVGNTNSRYRFSLDPAEFVRRWSEAGPGHHCAIGHGHQASLLQKVADLLGIRLVRIC